MNTSFDPSTFDLSKLRSQYFEDGEGFTQLEKSFSPDREVRRWKAKCDELQEALARSDDHRRMLERQIVVEVNNREKWKKAAEMEMVKLKREHEMTLCNFNLEAAKNQQAVESVSRETHLLHQQLLKIQSEKTQAVKVVAQLKKQVELDAKDKRAVEAYLKKFQEKLKAIRTQSTILTEAKDRLEQLCKWHEGMVKQLRDVTFNLDASCKSLTEENRQLKMDLEELKTRAAADVNLLTDRDKALDSNSRYINELKMENLKLNESVVKCSDAVMKETVDVFERLDSICDSLQECDFHVGKDSVQI